VTLFARNNHAPSWQGLRDFASLDRTIVDVDTATAGATIIVSPTKLDDFRFNWSRATGRASVDMENLFGAVAPPDSMLFPAWSSPETSQAIFSMSFTSSGVTAGTRTNNCMCQLNFVDTFSMIAGIHQVKFGIDYRGLTPTNSGFNSWAAVSTNYASLVAGIINLYGVFTADPITARPDNYSMFAQDTWKATDRLTLTYPSLGYRDSAVVDHTRQTAVCRHRRLRFKFPRLDR
jgi:outer membrane receptor protein involved in Fe transport